jgi:hypothetical protein
MPEFARYPEIVVSNTILENKHMKFTHLEGGFLVVKYEHPNLGEITEIFEKTNKTSYCLKMVYPEDLQDEDEIYMAKEYYNLHLLDGWETYLEYFNPEDGWYLLSRNFDDSQEVLINNLN